MSSVCAVCGAPLTKRKQLYCSAECRAEAKRERLKQSYKPSGKPSLYRSKVCPDCGAEFVGHIKTIRCRECQQAANRKADAEAKRRKAAGKARALGSTDLCQRCGTPYTVESGMQKYCHDCAASANREHHAKRMREIYAARPELRQARAERRSIEPVQRTCIVCGCQFSSQSFALTCSPECQAKHAKEYMTDYDSGRKERRAEYGRERRSSMTEEQRLEKNRKAREAYARRKTK